MDVLSTEDAAFLLQHKDILKPGLVNFVGKVIAVSEVFRVKKDAVFIVQFPQRINILIKKTEYLHWQKILTPQQEYIMTKLRATTLKKGAGDSLKVFVPWTGSEIVPASEKSYVQADLKTWLRQCGGDLEAVEDIKSIVMKDDSESPTFGSYKGQITCDEFSVFGFYKLDHKVGLYICCVPAVDDHFVMLRVGDVITVYNAHLYSSKQEVRIMCCMSTCIKVTELSPLNTSPLTSLPATHLQQTIWKFGLSRYNMDKYIELVNRLHHRLHPLIKTRHVLRVIDGLLDCDLVKLPDQTLRTYIQEFTEQPHQCCITKNDQDELELSDFIGVEDIFNDLQGTGTTSVISSGSGKVLVGILSICKKNGQVLIIDKTGSVKCVVASSNKTVNSDIHLCNPLCCCGDLEPGSKFRCASVHTCCLGNVIAVTKFSIVQKPSISNIIENCQKYIQFSMEDAILLYRGKRDHSSGNHGNKNQTFFVYRCEALLFDKRKTDDCLRACAVGFILPEHLQEKHYADVIVKFCLKMKQENFGDYAPQQEHNSNQPQETAVHCDKENDGKVSQVNSLPPPVIVLLQGRSVAWYNLLYPGCVYRVISPAANQKKSNMSLQLKRAVSKAGGKSCMVIPEDSQLQSVFPDISSACTSRWQSLLKISTILSDKYRCSSALVSCICEVKTEEMTDKSYNTSGSHQVENASYKLQVSDLDTSHVMDLYFNSEQGPYPIGLLPGSVIYCQNIERRVSRLKKVYCHFSSVSSVQILQYSSDGGSTENSQKGSQTTPNTEPLFLSQLWTENHSTFQCVGYVQKIVKVSLKCVCGTCGTMSVNGVCTSSACGGQITKSTARACFIVEDGTGVAMVTCFDTDVQTLLLLSDEEWNSLKEVVESNGEIFIQQKYPFQGTDIERFVYFLCDNQMVKRNWQFTLRRSYSQSIKKLDEIPLDEFVVKKVDTGLASVETRCLPFLYLDCMSISTVDCLNTTIKLLSS